MWVFVVRFFEFSQVEVRWNFVRPFRPRFLFTKFERLIADRLGLFFVQVMATDRVEEWREMFGQWQRGWKFLRLFRRRRWRLKRRRSRGVSHTLRPARWSSRRGLRLRLLAPRIHWRNWSQGTIRKWRAIWVGNLFKSFQWRHFSTHCQWDDPICCSGNWENEAQWKAFQSNEVGRCDHGRDEGLVFARSSDGNNEIT